MRRQRAEEVLQLKITLQGIKPPIWRRVLVPGNCRLDELHAIIQEAMPWYDCHLHVFEIGDEEYGPRGRDWDDEEYLSERRQLRGLVGEGQSFHYVYDFGDDWRHRILIEKILPADPEIDYPHCVTGRRKAPPEDCGGPWGYREMLEVLDDPEHPERETRVEWLGGSFDPEAFSAEQVNLRLARLRGSREGRRPL